MLLSIILISFLHMNSFNLYDFNKEDQLNNWFVVNDGVMGGLSKGNLKINTEGHAEFYGFVSLENNGGFSSIRHDFKRIDITSYSKLKLRIKGDGKRYQLRIKNNRRDYHSYIFYIQTTTEWQEVEIPLEEFYPYFRGYKLNKPNFNESYIEQFGILIGNKTAENFKLIVDRIELI